MDKYVIDTQALVRHPHGRKVFNDKVDSILGRADSGECIVFVAAVVMFEIGYLFEKGRIPISIADIQGLLDSSVNYVEEPLGIDVIAAAFEITDIPELHDGLIAGTARCMQCPVITNDPVILGSAFVECVT